MRTNHTLTGKWNPKAIQLTLKSRNTLEGPYHYASKLKFLCTDLRHLLTGKVRCVLLRGQPCGFLTAMAQPLFFSSKKRKWDIFIFASQSRFIDS
jgi:hypothetical protein